MTDRQLKSLNKTQLLGILRQQEIEIQALEAEKSELSKRLEERALAVKNAGSLAEASLSICGVFQAAQSAAEVYLESIKVAEEQSRAAVERETRAAREKAEAMLREAARKCDEASAREKQITDGLWEDFHQRLNKYVQAHSELREFSEMIGKSTPTSVGDSADAI